MDGEFGEDDLIQLSALQHYSYCPRQCGLIHLEGVFEENIHTLRGRSAHEQVDIPESVVEGAIRVERAMPLYSRKLGLVGKSDVVEFDASDIPYPVEYKHGPKRKGIHDDIQLAAQCMCLEEMLSKAVPAGAIYHHSSRRRRHVDINFELRQLVIETISSVREMLSSGVLPLPPNDERCKECSLKDSCQPEALDATRRHRALMGKLYKPEA